MKRLRGADDSEETGGVLKRGAHIISDLERGRELIPGPPPPLFGCPARAGGGGSGPCPTPDGAGWITRAGYAALPGPLRQKAEGYRPHDAWEPDEANLPPVRADDVRDRAAGGRDALGEPVPKGLKDVFAADFLHE